MNKIFKVAVIGCSHMGHLHIEGVIAKEGAELFAICDTDPKVLAATKEKYNAPLAVCDYKELVDQPELDAVVIVTPDQVHKEMTVAFLKAGKHVLCEKPMALTMEECDEMRRAEKESGKMLMIGQVCRCTPAFRMTKNMIAEGKIGELFFVESEYAHNYEKARGAGDWRVTPERHGIIGGGCHAVDLLRWIAGDPEEVYAISNHKCLTEWPTNDCTVALMKFPNNVAGKVFASIGCCRNYTMRSAFYGTTGTIICDNTSPTITLFESGEPLENGKTRYTKGVEINNHNITAEIDDFIEALMQGKAAPVSSLEGASTVAVCRAAVESSATGLPVKVKYPEA